MVWYFFISLPRSQRRQPIERFPDRNLARISITHRQEEASINSTPLSDCAKDRTLPVLRDPEIGRTNTNRGYEISHVLQTTSEVLPDSSISWVRNAGDILRQYDVGLEPTDESACVPQQVPFPQSFGGAFLLEFTFAEFRKWLTWRADREHQWHFGIH